MTQTMLNRMKWRLYRLYERLSRLALFAIAILLALICWILMVYLPLQQSIQTLQHDAQQKPMTASPNTDKDQLATFKGGFPQVALRANKVDQLMQMIAQQGFQVDEVRYQTEASENALLSTYRVTFNTQNTYPNIHRLLNTVLVEMPFVALDKLSLRRESVQDQIVDVEVSFNFYFQK
jgi:cell division protein FtsX